MNLRVIYRFVDRYLLYMNGSDCQTSVVLIEWVLVISIGFFVKFLVVVVIWFVQYSETVGNLGGRNKGYV